VALALIGMAVWSLKKLREYLQTQRIVGSISLEWLWQILRRRYRHGETLHLVLDNAKYPQVPPVRLVCRHA
jgi:hypothetical protein